jgi:hypothetical protein
MLHCSSAMHTIGVPLRRWHVPEPQLDQRPQIQGLRSQVWPCFGLVWKLLEEHIHASLCGSKAQDGSINFRSYVRQRTVRTSFLPYFNTDDCYITRYEFQAASVGQSSVLIGLSQTPPAALRMV